MAKAQTAPALAAAEHRLHIPDRRILTFIGVLAAMFLAALDQTIVSTAMPRIVRELNGLSQYSAVTTAYLLTSTAMIPIVGKLSEQLGRKRVFLTGIVFFLFASVLCGQARDMNQLVLFRGIQGLGAGVIMGTAFVIIADLFAPAERGKYTGFMSAVFGLSSIVGPLVGGYLTDNANFGWRWVFYVNIPIGIAVLLGLWFTFPSLRRAAGTAKAKIDYLGAAVIAGGAALVTLGATRAGTSGWSDPWVLVLIGVGVLMLVLIPFYEARVKDAMLPPQMFKSSIFAVSTIVSFLLGVGMFSSIVFIPLFLQGVVGVSALQSGELIWPMMAGMMAGSIGGGIILTRTGRYKIQALVGLSLMAAGIALMTLLNVHSTWIEVSRDMIVFGLGLGTTFPVLNVAAQNAVEVRFIGPAVSSMQFIRQIGATLGLAVLGSVFNQELKDKMAAAVPPSTFNGLPAQLSQGLRSLAQDPQAIFSGGAAEIMKRVPAAMQPQVAGKIQLIRDALKPAIADSMHTIFLCALALIIVAVVISLFMREIPLQKAHEWGTQKATRGPEAHPEPII